MTSSLKGLKVAILGGDQRETFLAKKLAESGCAVSAAGLLAQGENIKLCEDINEALNGVQVIVLPVPGINDSREIYSSCLAKTLILSEEILAGLPPGVLLFVGTARPILKDMAARHGLQLIELLNLDEVAILNSIPSAEGAIQIAMEKLPTTIHGARSFVLGFGRTGITLARMLTVLGSRTTVAARNPAHRARAVEMNCTACDFNELPGLIGQAELIFNTVPYLVLDEQLLKKVYEGVLIVDLASFPGGTDFGAARRLGINAELAPGLPGKVAPKTAGKILADVIPRLIASKLALSNLT
ncbi:MAG: dipicolinate synthase subunit DpsA [Eubacteriales bacterium]